MTPERATEPYGSVIAEHFRHPRNQGGLPNASTSAEGVNPLCGDRVRFAVALDENGTITEARFVANACAICVAAASMLTERVHGLASGVAGEIADDEMLLMLGEGLPTARVKCATLPLETLRRALALL